MPTYRVGYVRTIVDTVLATDRDLAAQSAIAAGADLKSAIVVYDDAGGRYEVVAFCPKCRQPVWSDQAHHGVWDGDYRLAGHLECPNRNVLAAGAGLREVTRTSLAEVLAQTCASEHLFAGPDAERCACGAHARSPSPRGMERAP